MEQPPEFDFDNYPVDHVLSNDSIVFTFGETINKSDVKQPIIAISEIKNIYNLIMYYKKCEIEDIKIEGSYQKTHPTYHYANDIIKPFKKSNPFRNWLNVPDIDKLDETLTSTSKIEGFNKVKFTIKKKTP